MSYWDRLERHAEVDMWMAHPRVRERINLRVSGERGVWPTTWLARRIAPRLPLGRVASLGSGLGALERDLVRQGIARRVVGVELAPRCVEEARRLAAGERLDDRIDYVRADARDWLTGERGLDAVFFHGSLHHFDRLDDLLARVRSALAPGGLVYLDEYVGPARDEWRPRHLLRWNLLYYRLPRALRRTRIVRAPRNDDDPTESIASSSIPAAMERAFELVERRDYGGQLVAWMYPYLARADADAHARAVEWLLDREDADLARAGARAARRSHHAVLLARLAG
jgi:SAM-dependent methyltransferase